VRAAVKGGVEVEVSGLRAFCPISQLDTAYVEDAESYVGQRLSFAVRSLERSGRGGRPNLVLSRRELLEAEERKRREEALARLAPGAVVRGRVTSVTGYGAFVDLGGVEGLLHVSEMAHGRVEDPSELVQEGDELEVKVLTIEEREGRDGKGPSQRISLSRRALLDDPWKEVGQRFAVGTTVAGRVMRLEPYGAFVRVAPGIEGLVHVSELTAERHVSHPREVVELGQDVEVRILDVDAERKRISLSMAAARGGDEKRGEAAPADAGGGLGSGLGSLARAFEKADKKDA
jgi:small subunit ribosomal protein S1